MSDLRARAEREAAAIIAETGFIFIGRGEGSMTTRSALVSLLGIAWLQGANYGTHETLAHVEDAFDELRAAL